MRIAIVVAQFNQEVTEPFLQQTVEHLNELGIPMEEGDITWVPGAIEIPIIAQQYALSQEYNAVICLGAVIKGETDHYNYVCQQVSSGCQEVALKCDVPIIFGVLTTENLAQALARVNGEYDKAGRYYAETAVKMAHIMSQFNFNIEIEEEQLESV
jgi:6,7-dimethyl-8-ribityllumazine synthase